MPSLHLLRTIRLDPSDTFVFERAATSGEWAVPGGFAFWDADPAALAGKARQAFRAGFLGLGTFGWSTLVVVVEATVAERAEAVAALGRHLRAAHGAPDEAAAWAAAEEEITYAQELAAHPAGTLIALARGIGPDGALREQFRTLHAATARQDVRQPCSAGAFAIVEDALGSDPAGLTPSRDEEIDLVAMTRTRTESAP